MSVCNVPGCGELTPGGGRCPTHERQARQRGTSGHHARAKAGGGYGARWQRTRKAYLAAHPVCECDECMTQPTVLRPWATDVDHIDGLGPKGPRGFDWDNLRAMSHAHHSRHTARTQPGGWNDRE